jgi:hypothetical protein
VSVSALERHDIAVVPAVAFHDASPLTAAVPLAHELTPSHTQQPGADRGAQIDSQRLTRSLTVGHEIWGAG